MNKNWILGLLVLSLMQELETNQGAHAHPRPSAPKSAKNRHAGIAAEPLGIAGKQRSPLAVAFFSRKANMEHHVRGG